MRFRSITFADSSGDVINAVLLFGFAVPLISKNFLVYTFNEESRAGRIRVYLAALYKQGETYSLGALETDRDHVFALQALKQIVKTESP
ncbi:hypothetical protein JV174_15210 [Pseudomonas sp. SDM007_2]|uniref:hypothetical protein n=1 Tax=Pseudomonas hygromyciniae TaxID=2812000 RepID=UPI00196809F6|nr:hypothetical protein [Pseudomonas hygromyciniae]MBN0978580.1 hypothetical protein [Pseudomonas hygromyciniae]